MAMREQIRLVAPFQMMTGYAKFARAALRAAILAGYEVQAVESDFLSKATRFQDGRIELEKIPPKRKIELHPIQDAEFAECAKVEVAPDAPTISIQLPHNLFIWPQYQLGPSIGWTMTESDNLCPSWQHGARSVDLLLAPSAYCLETFRRVVPEVESDILHLPVDGRLWEPNEYADRPNGAPPFLFLSVFSTNERKQWRMLIQAFAEEFHEEGEEVGLIVKPTDGAGVGALVAGCQQMGAWISMDTEQRTDWMMASLYRACDVIVQPSSEGFGLPFAEAALVGKPSVALSLGGSADVVTADTGYPVPGCVMEPLIGHMPATYPRKHHRFATCNIDALRATMRRAYEEEKGGFGKGQAARERALKCFTPEAIAPRLVEMVEKAKAVHAKHRSILAPKRAPKWGLIVGAWGDVFGACGKLIAEMKTWEIEKIGVIWYGSDKKIADWLRLQPWAREVIAIHEPDKKEMTKNFGRACQCRGIHSRAWLREILMQNGMLEFGSLDDVAFTQLRLNEREMPTYWHGPRLSVEAMEWAREKAEAVGEPFYLLNPLSIASNKMRDHWRYWSEAIQWLLDRTSETYVMVSEKVVEWPEHPRLHNLTGQTRSMQDVLALAELSEGVISTSNNLGIYAPIAGIPAMIACARTCGKETFYHRWMECENVWMIDWEDAMPQFLSALGKFFLGGKPYGSKVEDRPGSGQAAARDTGLALVGEGGGAG